jgi:hypothetical protein
MTKPLHRILALGAIVSLTLVAGAAAEPVKVTPVKGATYKGLVGSSAITVKVDGKGKTAKVSLADAPIFCSSGGGGPEPHSGAPATISKKGALSATITFFTTGSRRRKLATVTISAHFYTFGKATPVLQGQVKSKFAIAGDSSCNGQESFQAVKG